MISVLNRTNQRREKRQFICMDNWLNSVSMILIITVSDKKIVLVVLNELS